MEHILGKFQDDNYQISTTIYHISDGSLKWMPALWKMINMAVELLSTVCKNLQCML